MAAKVPGSIFIGMIVTAIFGMIIGQIPMPHGIVSGAPSIAPTFGQAVFHLKDINTPQLFMVVLTLIAVKPVLPPIAIPALDSTEVPSGAVPNTDPSTIASESDVCL